MRLNVATVEVPGFETDAIKFDGSSIFRDGTDVGAHFHYSRHTGCINYNTLSILSMLISPSGLYVSRRYVRYSISPVSKVCAAELRRVASSVVLFCKSINKG